MPAAELEVGDRVLCLYRDAEVVIYDWSLPPIPWPLCYHADSRGMSKGLLVDEELARAVRQNQAWHFGDWCNSSSTNSGSVLSRSSIL